MNGRNWRILIVAGSVILIPAAITGGVFAGMTFADAHRFNRCLGALPTVNLRDPGVGFILEDLKGTGRFEGASWNINEPYRAGAYNILVPSGSVSKWPEVCDVPQEVPDCLASPKNRYIICNPAMGRQFESRLLHSGAASVETDAAIRFVLLTFLGHELGHIEMEHSLRARHLIPEAGKDSLSCVHRSANGPSEEERADDFGTELACNAVTRRLSMESLPDDPAEGLKLVSSLQDQLDDSYFLRDDACVGDDSYPSIGRRKHTFSLKYLQCIYPSEWNPAEILAADDAKSFDNLEQWLERRQKSGQIASGSYGKSSLYAHTVTALPFPDSYLTFDSTGVDSRLWLVRPNRNRSVQISSLEGWGSVGRVLNSSLTRDGRSFWIWLAHDPNAKNGVLIHLMVSCAGEPGACSAPSILQSIPIPEGFQPVAGEENTVALLSADSVEDPISANGGQGMKEAGHGLRLDSPEDAVAAISKDEIVVLGRKGNGLHDLSVLRGTNRTRRLLMMPPPEDGESLEAAAIEERRLLLSSEVNPLAGDSSLYLWDCPAVLLERSAQSPADDCVRYRAPGEIEHAVAMATRDLSSMFDMSIRFPQDCGGMLAIQHRGWLWVVDREKGLQDLLPADGIIHCDLGAGQLTTFRARRIDRLALALEPVQREQKSLLSVAVVH